MRILFFIEPWIENASPSWKENYIWWWGKLVLALKKSSPARTEVVYIVGDDVAQMWDNHINCDARYVIIEQRELKAIFPNARTALVSWLKNTQSDKQMASMMALIKEKLQAFVPDVIFTTTPAQFLQKLFPDALILHRDAVYCREPWPDELTSFDPFGLYAASIIRRHQQELLSLPNTPSTEAFVAEIDRLFLEPIQKDNPFSSFFETYRKIFSKLLLLPLQSNGHCNFYAYTEFADQFDYLTYVLESVPAHIGVVVIQHPDNIALTSATLTYLRKKYMHFLYEDTFVTYHSPAQYAMPLVDGVVCVSSGLCYQALLWNKPLFIIGNSHFRAFSEGSDLTNIDAALERHHIRRTGLINWLLTRYQFSYSFLYDGNWLNNYLKRGIEIKRTGELSLAFFDFPFASNKEVIERLASGARALVTRVITSGNNSLEEKVCILQNAIDNYEQKICILQNAIDNYEQKICVLQNAIGNYEQSISWKITRPLRWLASSLPLLRRFFLLLRLGQKAKTHALDSPACIHGQ